MRNLPVLTLDLKNPQDFGNVAEKLSSDERRTLATDLIELIGIDRGSMGEFLDDAKKYLDQVEGDVPQSPNTSEQEGTNEGPPPTTEMTLSAVIQFSARATDAILGEPDLARASEPGGNTEKLAEWVSSQLRTQDPHWILDTDPLTIHMSVTGLSWRKREFDDEEKEFRTRFIPCTHVIINKNVKSHERAPRITEDFERYPYEIDRSIERKKWVDYDPVYDERDPQAPKKFYSCDCWLDLDDDGVQEPWTIVISRDDTPEVVRIRPRWSKKTVTETDDVLFFNPIRRFYPYMFLPDPKGGFFPMGFGKLLNKVERTADTLLGAIMDTAKSESQNGGVLAGSSIGVPQKVEIKGDRVTTLPTDGAPLTNRFEAFPSKTVSAGSVATLEKLMALGDRLAGTLNVLDKAPASMTATMAKGIIDTGSQIQSAVHRRMVASMTQEIHMFVKMADAYDVLPEGLMANDGGAVAITADPQLATEMQRSALASFYMELITQALAGAPWKVEELQLRLMRVLRIPDPEKLIGQIAPPQLTPDEKAKAVLGAMKAQTDKIKAIGQVAQFLTQSLKNLVDAGGGMIDQRAALLQMAMIEGTVQQLVEGANNVGSGLDGMAATPGNGGAAPPAPGAQGSNGADLLGGPPGEGNAAGPGGGAV